jgi:hypothetical protein
MQNFKSKNLWEIPTLARRGAGRMATFRFMREIAASGSSDAVVAISAGRGSIDNDTMAA